ncbi:MAG: sensor histidine kinase [Clostridia bacterium]|nr:sensor histidine kinase [Clostridia bacterium]
MIPGKNSPFELEVYENDGEKIIEIRVSLEDDIVVLTFADYGKGIDENEAKRLFVPFYANSRNKGSLGLGLNVVYNTVAYLMRGSIDLEFGVNKGLKNMIRWLK